MTKNYVLLTLLLCFFSSASYAQLTGTKTIPGDYATIAAAVTALNAQGVGAGGVTFNVATGYTETLSARIDITATGTAGNPIIFQKSGGGANPLVTSYVGTATATSAVMDGMIALIGSDFVTFDGINLVDAAANVDATTTMEYGYGLFKASDIDGANSNTIKNCTITLNRVNNTAPTTGPAFQGSNGIALLNCTQLLMQTSITVTSVAGASSNNKFYSNTIQNVNCGITLSGFAGASPFTLCDTGNDIGGTSAGTGNTIINFGGGAAATVACAAVFVKDQWSFNVSFNTVNNNNGSGVNHIQTNRGIFANPSSIGASATINNNTVTIQGGSSTSAIDWAIDCEMAQSGAAGNTISINNNTVSMTKATASTVALSAIWVQSAPTTMNVNGNTITNFICSSTSTSTTDVGVIRSGLAGIGTLNINNNTINGVSFSGASGTAFCIGVSGSVSTAANINGNVINGITFTVANSRVLNVITRTAALNTAAVSISNNNIQGINYLAAGTGANTYITGTGTPLTQTISGNTFTNLSVNTTGTITFINHGYTIPSTGQLIISGNSIVTGFTRTAAGSITLTTSNSVSGTGSINNYINNNFSNITATGASTILGFNNTDGGTGSTKQVTGNVFNNWSGTTGTINCMNFTYWNGASNLSNNTITNITGQSTVTGVTIGAVANNANPLNISNNTINNLTSTGTGGSVTGITCSNTSAVVNINGNTIHTLSSTGASAVTGISIGGAVNTNVFKNKIYNLSGSNAISTVNGLLISAGTLVTASNNLIGDLKTPAANAAIPLAGINVGGGTTVNLFYNTVFLAGTSSGALFGSAAVNASTTPTLTLRNNLLVNTCVPVGATGFSAAYRRSTTTLTTYGASSDRNAFFAGNPSASNLIFYDGTNSDQTIAAFKSRVAPRDAASVSENPNFISTNGASADFLHINPAIATQLESGATNIAGITDDFDGVVRQGNPGYIGTGSAPDIGADEGNFSLLDITAPVITYSIIPSICSPVDITLTNVNILDGSGVPVSGALMPRIYYRKNAGAWFSQPGTLVSGSGTNGNWNFTIVIANMGGIIPGDVVSYYVIAQDIVSPTWNIGSNPVGVVAVDVNNVTTHPPTPNTTTYATPLSGTYAVGPTGVYPTITAAVASLLANGLSNPVVFELQTTYVSTGETFPITLGSTNACGSGLSASKTVTIRPATGASNLSINGTNAGPTIDINSGVWWRLDGRPGGSGSAKELSITNNNVAGQAIQYINEGSNNTVRFCKLQSVNTSATSGTVVFGTTTGANGNDNNLIDNCDIFDGATTPTNAIHSLGSITTVNTYNDNDTISNCNIFNFFNAGVNCTGIKTDAGNSTWTITNNSFYQTVSPRTFTTGVTMRPLWITPNTGNLTPQASGFVITGNFIGGTAPLAGGSALTVTSTTTALFFGMDLSVGNGAATSVQNNTIQNINFTTTSTATPMFVGISVVNGNANIGTITGNTIGAAQGNGSITVTNITSSSGVAWGIRLNGGTSTTLDCRNNTVGSFTLNGSATILPGFVGIGCSGGSSTNVSIIGNLVGSTTAANSINLATASTGTGSATGIQVTSGPSVITINNNTVANLNSNSTATVTAQVRGIAVTTGAPTINGNTVRNLSSAVAYTGTGFAVLGILQTATTGIASVTGNTIHSLSLTTPSTTHFGQCTGMQASCLLGSVVARNFIHSFDVVAGSPACFMTGIDVSGGSATFQNNMIRLGIKPDGSDLTAPLTVRGITLASTAANNFYFNSIYVGGANVGTNATNTFAFNRSATSGAHDFRNNIFVNNRSNATTGGKHYVFNLATPTTGFAPNYNDYQYTGTGGTFAFNGAADVPVFVSNWIAGDGSSIVGDPRYIAPTGNASTVDLHISASSPTVIESAGVLIASVTDDLDGQSRASLTPTDMGADAGNFVLNDISAPVIVYTPLVAGCGTGDIALNGVSITDGTGIPTSGTLRPRVYYRKNMGTWFSQPGTLATGTGTNGTWNFTMLAADMGGLAVSDVVQYYVIAQDVVAVPNISSNPSGAVATDVNNVSVAPPTPNSVNVVATFTGVYTVGAMGNYATITAAMAAYNSSCLVGPVTFSLIDPDYSTLETFPININAVQGASATNTLTIKPAVGVNSVITGSSTSAIFKLNGADYVIIDGSNNSVMNSVCPLVKASRNLTITNTNVSTTSAVIWNASISATNGATNNIYRNLNIVGNAPTTTFGGIISSSGTTLGSAAEAPNSNCRYENNSVKKCQYGIAIAGASTFDQDNVVALNDLGANVASDYLGFIGMFFSNSNNLTVEKNNVFNILTTLTNPIGINVAASVLNSTFNANVIGSIHYLGISGYGGKGININTNNLNSNLVFSNNMISDLRGDGWNTLLGDAIVGIRIGATGSANTTTGGIKLYNNSVYLGSGTFAGSSSGTISAALYVSSTAANLDIRGNIFGTNLNNSAAAAAKTYAINSAGATAAFTNLDFNDYFVGGTQGVLGFISTVDRLTLADIVAGFGSNFNSKNITPVFTSNVDLHLNATSATNGPLICSGTALGLLKDIDCQTRSTTNPTIGADEVVLTPAIAVVETSGLLENDGIICAGADVNLTASLANASSYLWSPGGQTGPSILVQPTSDLTYIVTVTTVDGCKATDSVTITVNPLPTVSIAAVPASICLGQSSVLTASGTNISSYLWSPGGETSASITVSPIITSTYDVIVTSAALCVNTSSSTVTVTNPPSAAVVPATATICIGQSQTLTASGGTSYLWSSGETTAEINVSPTSNTTYTVIVTGAGNCTSTASSVVTVNPLPSVTIDPTPATICSGGNIDLTANGGATYVWSTGDSTATINVMPTSATTYTVTVTSAELCSNTGSKLVSVTPLPNAAVAPATSTICNGQSQTLVASGGSSYAWSSGQSGASITVNPSTTTTYTVTVTGAGNCTSTATSTVTVNPLATITPTLTQPTTCVALDGAIDLTLGGASGPYSFNWFTPNGNGLINGQQNQTGLSVGNYFVTVTAGNSCTATAVISLSGPGGCGVCPTIGALSSNVSQSCKSENFTLTASDLIEMGITYGITFKYSAMPLVDPYVGGTVLGTVPNGSLTNNQSTATLVATIPTTGSYFIYAILDQTPLDPTCRPSSSTNITTYGCTPFISDPCACKNNATTLTNGQFDEVITVDAPVGQIWTVTAVTGLFQSSSPAPPAAPTPIAVGTQLFGTGNTYTLAGIHVDGLGYSVTVSNGTTTLTIGNTCYYPNPVITGLNNTYCLFNPAVTLSGSAQLGDGSGSAQGVGTFTVNGVPATEFVPSALGAGTHTVEFCFDAADDVPNGSHPGCTQCITQTVEVNPTPTVNGIGNQVYCAGVVAPSTVFGGTPNGVTFTWTNDNTAIGLGASGTGNLPSYTTNNATGLPLVATITVTPVFTNGGLSCNGTATTFTITINPTPVVNGVANQTFCAGVVTSGTTFSGSPNGVTFSWTNNNTAIGLGASGTGNLPSFTTTNGTNSPISGTITVTPIFTNGGISCNGTSITFTITVNPTPTVNGVANQTYCTGALVPSTIFGGTPTSVTFTWTNSNTAIGLGASGSGNLPAFTATNTTTGPIFGTITVTPNFTNGGVTCQGTPITFTITVSPVTNVGAQTNRTFCSGIATGGIVFSSTVPGTTFNWTNSNTLIGIGASGVGNIPSWIPVNNTAANIVGTITVTPVVTTNGVSCSGAPITFTITILPAPKAMCKNFTLNLDASGNGTLNPNDINNGSVGGTLTISKSTFNCGNIGANNVILTVTDVCGQTNTCVAVVTVADNVPPIITCPKSIVETLAPGECNKAVAFENPTAKDNCELGFTPAVITTTFASNNQFAGNMFNVTNNTTQPITLTSFEGNVTGAVGLPVSFQIFYTTTATTYVGNETNAAAWTSMGTANSTCAGLNNPTIVPIGGLTIQPGQTKGIYFVLTSYNIATNSLRYTNGNNVYTNGDMTITAGVGKATPNFTGTTFLSRIWNGRIRYNKVTAAPPVISQIDNTGFKNGDVFPKGTTCLVYQARDFAGNLSATCQVCIEIRGITNPTSTLTCNDLSNVSLDTNCLALINADMILEGGPYDCYSDYRVILTLNGKTVPNPITAEYAGKTLTATVVDKFSNNKCWGLLKIEDKVLPQIVCPPSVTISCAVTSDPGNIGAVFPNGLRFGTFEQYSDPTTGVNVYRFGDKKYRVKAGLIDKCSEVILTYNDVVQEFTCAASTLITKIITRKWAATDIYGNSTNCTQTISVRRAVLTELVMPRNWDGQVNNDRVLNLCKDMYSGDPNDYYHLDTAWVKLSNGNASPKAGVNAVDTILVGEFDPFHDPLNPGTDTLILRGTGMPAGATCFTIDMLYKDTKVQVCEDGYKLIRDWRILDWCTGQTRNYTQLIIVVDKTAPTLVCPVDLTASTDALDCKGSGVFPAPTITDICSPASLTYEVTYRGGTAFPDGGYIGRNADGSWRYSGLSCGTYNFKYTAKDGCGNVDSCITFDLVIRDITVPVPVCRSVTQVTLSNTPDDPNTAAKECGLTRVESYKFDEGSWDNCGQVYFKIRRANTFNPGIYDNDPRFEDNVWFNCEDVGKEVDVILRVYDAAPLIGHVGSVSDRGDSYRPTRTDGCGPLGNFNDCVVKVRVEDLVNPTITCPPQLNITCTAYDFSIPLTNADTSWFNKYLGKVVTADCNGNNTAGSFTYFNGFNQVTGSNGLAFDNCFVSIPQTFSAQLECGVGTITRTFRAVDRGGRQSNPCTQLIVVTNPTPFTINASHYTDPGSDLADPCDGAERIRVGANEDFVNDLYVSPNFSPDNIIWPDKVVELTSCTGIGSIGTECANTGKDAGRPRILRNDKCDLVAITFTDEVFPIAPPACVKILRTWRVIDWCQNKPTGRIWTYTQIIKLVNKVAPEFTGNTCKNDTICQYPTDCGPDPLTLCATATDDCTPTDQLKYTFFIDVNNNGTNDLQGSGSCVTLTKALGLSYGRHMITWAVEDICGNVKTCSKIFIVKDCKKPTPVSKLLTIELMPNNCQATLEAVKVNNFSWDNCTPMANLRFRLAKSGEYKADMTLAEVLALNDYVVFTAGELGTQTIGLFVIDADNNWDYVETFILVQSNMNPDCGGGTGTAAVSGSIQTEAKENVDKVDVKVNGTNKTTTDAQGFFNFLLNKNVSYTVAPEKLIDPRNGVTTADLVAINKHILAVDPLNSPYRRIAADINSDGKISTSDMVELRKLILFINDNFTSNTSWKMVDKSYSFKTTTPEKEAYPLNVAINPLQTAASANFVAVKVGDVNGSAKANSLLGDASDRSAGKLIFEATDATIAAGETKTVMLSAQDVANISGYQFTLNFDKQALEVVNVSGLNESNFGLSLLSEGAITASNDAVAADQAISITFKVKQATQLSKALSIGSRYTAAEAYTVNGDKYDVALNFNGTIAGSFQLLQNQPNPFNGKTVIGMVFPEATAATMTIFDATGRTLKVIQGDYAKGYNEVTIDQADLKATGILSYRLTTDKYSATKQMIIAE